MKRNRFNILILIIFFGISSQAPAETVDSRPFESMQLDKLENLEGLYKKLGNKPILKAIQRELNSRRGVMEEANEVTVPEVPVPPEPLPLIVDPVETIQKNVPEPDKKEVAAPDTTDMQWSGIVDLAAEVEDEEKPAALVEPELPRASEKALGEAQHQALVVNAYQGITTRNAIKANQALRELKRTVPESAEIIPIEAEIALMQGDFEKGARLFQELEDAHRGPTPFPYREQLAYALIKIKGIELPEQITAPPTVAVSAAALPKPETVVLPPAMDEEEVVFVDDSADVDGGTLIPRADWFSGREGTRVRSGILWRTGEILNGWGVGIRYDRSDISLSPDHRVLGSGASLNEGEFYLTKSFANDSTLKLGLGGSDEGALYSARVSGGQTLTWDMIYEGNARTDESLQLAAFGAREHRGRVALRSEFSDRLEVSLAGVGGTLGANSQTIGDWYGGEITITWSVTSPDEDYSVLISYIGDYRDFDIKSPEVGEIPVDDLVEQMRHRHGLRPSLKKSFSNLSVEMHVGAFYDVDNEAIEYGAGISLEWLLFRDPEMVLFTSFDWQSDGRGASEGAEIYEGKIGLSISL